MFGNTGNLGYLVQKLAGVEPVLDPVPRVRMKILAELVQDPKVTANVATYNLVQVIKQHRTFIYF